MCNSLTGQHSDILFRQWSKNNCFYFWFHSEIREKKHCLFNTLVTIHRCLLALRPTHINVHCCTMRHSKYLSNKVNNKIISCLVWVRSRDFIIIANQVFVSFYFPYERQNDSRWLPISKSHTSLKIKPGFADNMLSLS